MSGGHDPARNKIRLKKLRWLATNEYAISINQIIGGREKKREVRFQPRTDHMKSTARPALKVLPS